MSPDQLRTIETTAQQSMADMRRLLGLLRPEDGSATLDPQASLADLPHLLETAQASGQRVELEEIGQARPLPPAASLGAYRIVQEALTNARRHGAHGRHPPPDVLERRNTGLEVTNPVGPRPASRPPGSRHPRHGRAGPAVRRDPHLRPGGRSLGGSGRAARPGDRPGGPMTIRVLVTDDQPLIREALVALLTSVDGIEVVGSAADGASAVRLARSLEPDVVLMDIRMPVMDGVEATRQVRALPHPPAVVVLTTFDLDEYVLAAVRAGASGFLLKDGDADDLVAGIRSAAAGDAVLAPRAARGLMDHVAGRSESRSRCSGRSRAPDGPRARGAGPSGPRDDQRGDRPGRWSSARPPPRRT